MPSNADRAQRWMEVALGRAERNLAANGNVYAEGDTVYSYGSHFPMATVMRERPHTERGWGYSSSPTVGEPRWVLVNGDSYSITTSGHQGQVRSVIEGSGLPSVIIPFTALRAAGIDPLSIEILEVRPDRTERWTERVEPTGDFVGSYVREGDEWKTVKLDDVRYVRGDNGAVAQRTNDGHWEVERQRHFLGDSLFMAKANNGPRQRWLSSFDHQEARPLYFLCALPRSSKARTVEQALRDLRPKSVLAADEAGLEVTRQGDLFAIPTELTTREVKKLTPYGKGRIVKRPSGGVLGTRHSASQIVFATEGRVYARGTLYHEPQFFREPDHARRKMGDGKTWHLLTRNTVPRQRARERSTV